MTGQSTRLGTYTDDDKQIGEDYGKCFTGAKNNYRFTPGLDDNIIYYTFDFMGSGDTGSLNINGQRMNDKDNTVGSTTYKALNITSFADGEHKYYRPFKVTIIVDKLNNKAYYQAVKSQTGDKLDTTIVLGQEANYIDIGNGYGTTNQRYFFKNFSYGTIEYEINGADTVTAGESAEYTMQETGTSLGVNYTPEKTTYALETEVQGVTLADNTLTVSNTVADNTEVTINALINGTKVASKTVTVINPVSDEDIISINDADAYVSEDGKGNIRFVTTVNSDEVVSEYGTWVVSADNFTGSLEALGEKQKQKLEGKNAGVKTTFSADLVNIESGKFASPFYAISYIKIGDKTSWSNIKSAKVNDYAQAN